MKIAILGAGGIGKFHAREFSSVGCEVVAILGSSKESSERTANMLKENFNVDVRPYFNIETLLDNENIDAVSICTPPELHYCQTLACLKNGLHVLCEKPFIGDDKEDKILAAKELLDLAETSDKIISINTQWPSVVPKIRDYVDISNVEEFEMYMEHGVMGVEMLQDHLPHMNSMLIALCGKGELENIRFPIKESEKIVVEFDYVSENKIRKVRYILKFKVDRPRRISFIINDNKFERKVGENYRQGLKFEDRVIDIEDPFKVSIGKFVGAVGGRGEVLIDSEDVLENVRLQDEIIKGYIEE